MGRGVPTAGTVPRLRLTPPKAKCPIEPPKIPVFRQFKDLGAHLRKAWAARVRVRAQACACLCVAGPKSSL